MRTVDLMPLLIEKEIHFDFCTTTAGEGHLDKKIKQLGSKIFPCLLKQGYFKFERKFLQFLKRSDYDIIHSHLHYFSGNIVRLAHKAGIKGRIVHFRNITDGKALTLRRRLYRHILCGMINKHATSILSVCRGAMELAWSKDWQKDPRCCVNYNGIDLSKFQPNGSERQDILRELGLPENSKLVIYVARFRPQKAHDILLDVAEQVISCDPKIHFLLIGDGDLKETAEAKVRKLGVTSNVHFLGLRNDVSRLLKASDCFVLPSLWEGLPGVVLEAVASNLPVVSTDLPGVREISEYTDLIDIVPIGDGKALSRGILEILYSPRKRDSKEVAFQKVFSLQSCADRLFQIYTSQM